METAEPTQALQELIGWAQAHGIVLDGLTVERPSLEDVYLRLTSHDTPEHMMERSTR